MSNATSPATAKLNGLHRNAKVAMIAGLAIIVVVPFGLIRLQRYFSSPAPNANAAVVSADQPDQEVEAETNDDPLQFLDSEPFDPVATNGGRGSDRKPYMSSQERAIRDRQILLLRQQGDAIRNSVLELTTVQESTTQSLEQLLSNDDGRKIAAQPELIDQFMAVQKSFESKVTPAANLSAEAEILLAPLQHIESEPIQTHFENTLQELAEKVDAQLFAAQLATRQLGVLFEASAKITAIETPLSQAIERRSTELEQQQVADMTQAVEAARKAVVDQAAEEAAEAQRKLSEAERAVARVEEQQRLDDLRAKEEAVKSELAKAQLEREFQRDLPMIKRFLRPLLVEAFTQPDHRGRFVPSDTKGPVSLAKLLGSGAINPTVNGRNGLYYTLGSQRERDRGSFPRYVGGAGNDRAVQPTMERFQELVVKYGNLMVEKGMLAP